MPRPEEVYCLACKAIVKNHLVGDISQHFDGVFDCPCNCTNVVPRELKGKYYFVQVVDLKLTEGELYKLMKRPADITDEDKAVCIEETYINSLETKQIRVK